jgi:hypothetical protein
LPINYVIQYYYEHYLLLLIFLDEDAKKKWANLRDTYNSNRKTYESRIASGASAVEEPRWIWWKYFAWYTDATRKSRYATSTQTSVCPTNL